MPTGAGEEKAVDTGRIQPEVVEWLPDNKHILLSGSESDQPPKTYLLDPASGSTMPVTLAGVRASGVSPDGQFVTIVNKGRLILHSLNGRNDVEVGSLETGISIIRWSDDGRHLYLQQTPSDRRSTTIFRLDIRTRTKEIWRQLKLPDATALFLGSVRMSADGKSYAFSFQRDLATLYLVKGVK